ncbi:MAG: STAS domain-containing protein [Sedimentisphaerales bacterium]|nr:STAS domain-containing protein [Sedimentisphaerales bacterium]
MAIQHWSDEIIVLELPDGPEMADELTLLAEYVAEREKCNVVVDFAAGGEVTPSSLSMLVKLRQLTAQGGARLVLCNVNPTTEEVFSVTGLNEVFELTRDKFAALATLDMIG